MFFLESTDVIDLPLAAFYSRSVTDPNVGLRATWRTPRAGATVWTLSDDGGSLVLRGAVRYRRTLAARRAGATAPVWAGLALDRRLRRARPHRRQPVGAGALARGAPDPALASRRREAR
jgi:hypothetical protein